MHQLLHWILSSQGAKRSLPELPWRQGQGKKHIPEWSKELWLSGQNSILYFTFCCSLIFGVLLTPCSDWGSQMRFKLPNSAVRAVLLMCLHSPPLPSWRLFHILLQATQTAPSGSCTCPASFLPKPQHPFPAAHLFPVHSSQAPGSWMGDCYQNNLSHVQSHSLRATVKQN